MTKTYDQRKQQVRAILAAQSAAGRDIYPLPQVKHPRLRNTCKLSFRKFCETYFPESFYLGFSGDHLKAIAKIEIAVLQGGLFALAMPRGSGKTTLAEKACIWAILYGHRSFVCLVGASETAANELLQSIKIELECNERLQEDFPEVCWPIIKLDGITNRANGQLYQGQRTRIFWGADEIVIASIPGSIASGACIKVAGITGRIRGLKHTKPDGISIRPDLVIIDDPQTNESANSIEQTRKRVQILQSDILGLAGPGKKISGIMPCTVIRAGDMADQILDSTKHPAWQGERCKLLYAMPTNNTLWEQYEVIRSNSLREKGTLEDATAFYAANKDAMDQGAIVAWEERYNPDEISAIQNCMDLLYQDRNSFHSEMQNEPVSEDENPDNRITPEILISRLNGLKRGIVPLDCDKLTMYVDVQKPVLFYVICAWRDDYTGAVIDYGSYPQQDLPYYTLSTLRKTLQTEKPKLGLEAQLYDGLTRLISEKLTNDYQREDDTLLRIEKCLIDANWSDSTDIVYKFCRQSTYSALLVPAHGKGIGADQSAMKDWKKHPGEKHGYNWIMYAGGKRAAKHLMIDTNSWKSFTCNRLNLPHGETGCLSIYGNRLTNHDVFFEQLQAEYKVPVTGKGRTVDIWKAKPNKDNHFWDCLVGCVVAANLLGCTIPEITPFAAPRTRISLAHRFSSGIEQAPAEPTSGTSEEGLANPQTGKLSLKVLMEKKRRQ